MTTPLVKRFAKHGLINREGVEEVSAATGRRLHRREGSPQEYAIAYVALIAIVNQNLCVKQPGVLPEGQMFERQI